LDVIELTGNFAVQNQNNEDYKTYPIPRTNYIEVNHETTGLDNLNIRRALYKAIDREAFVNNILQNCSIATNGFVSREVAWNPETEADFRDDATIVFLFLFSRKKKKGLKGFMVLVGTADSLAEHTLYEYKV